MNISTYGHEINHLNESYLYSFGKLSYSAFLLDTEFSIDEVYTAGKIMLYYSLQGDKGLAERYRRPFAEPRPVVSSSAGNMSMNRERYENLQVPNLRELCTLRGLSSLGKKSELIERLDTGNHSANNTAVLMDDQHYQWPSMPKTIAMNKSRYFRSNIASLLTREDFLPDGGKLIFPLFHVYESEKELPAESNLIDNGFALHHDACESPMLKGADSLFLLALRNTRIPLQLLR